MAGRRRNPRLCLFYKLPNGSMDMDLTELGLTLLRHSTKRKTKYYNRDKLIPVVGKDKHSPLWTGTVTVIRTIEDWNS